MFEVGFTEIVLILGIALLVLGPQRLPKLAADLGRWAGKARGMARQLKTQLEQEASTYDPLRDTSASSSTIHAPPQLISTRSCAQCGFINSPVTLKFTKIWSTARSKSSPRWTRSIPA